MDQITETMDSTQQMKGRGRGKAPLLPLQSPRQQKRPRVPEHNRQRAMKACNECRRLKERCSGEYPCARCIRTKRVCDFNTNRSAPFSSSNRLNGGESVERMRYLEDIAKHFLGDVPLALPDLKRISENLKTGRSTTEAESSEVDLNELEDLKLEDETFTVTEISQNTAHYSGEFSHWNFSKRVQRHVDEALNEGTDDVIEFWRATQLQSTDSTIFTVLESLPPRPVVEFLVRIFFRYAQTNSFYVGENWLRNKLEILYETPSSITASDSDWICALLMVFAIGSQFAHMEAGPLDSAGTVEYSNNGITGEEEVGVAIYHMASKLIPDVITIASVESFQACLLLAHYALPLDAHGLGYTYLGLSLRIGIQNGIHRKYIGNEFDAFTIETRNRLWWQAYTLERRICILHGRPLSVSHNDVDADLPEDLPGFIPPGQTSKFANISALIHLVNKLTDIYNAIKLLRHCPKRLQPVYFERIFEARKNLRTWWSTLPASCKDINPFSPVFRQNIHLALSYHIILIYMGRPFIFSDPRTATPGTDKSPKDRPQIQRSSSRMHSRAALVADAVEAAIEVVRLCQLLEDNCGLARASYTEFTSCRAALLVILAQSLNERTEHLKASMTNGVKLIKGMAVHNTSATSDVSYIEAMETAINRLEIRSDKTPDQTTQPQDVETGYDQFKNWAIMWKHEQTEKSDTPLLNAQAMHPTTSDNWNDFNLDFNDMGVNSDSLFQFDSQMSGFGLDDILTPFQAQRSNGEIPDEQWQNELVDLDSFGMGTDPTG